MSSSPPTEAPRWRNVAGWSLRTRLVGTMVVLLALLGLVVGITAEAAVRNRVYSQLDAQLHVLSDHALDRGPDGLGRWHDKPPPGAPTDAIVVLSDTAVPALLGGQVQITLGPQNQRFDSSYLPLPKETLATLEALATDGDYGQYRDVHLGSAGDYRVLARSVAPGAVTIVGLPLRDTHATLWWVAGVTGLTVLVALLAAGWAGALIVRRTLAPLHRVAATATRVSELKLERGDVHLSDRVPEADTDPRTEVGQVGAALNRLLDHVGNALEARHASEMQVRQFVADASHELRTPLAAIRGYAELSRRSRTPFPEDVEHVLRRVESEAKRMTVLVEDLLLLARLDAGRPLAHEPVDLTVLAVDAVSDAHAAGPGHDWRLALPEEPVQIAGDRARLHQVLANLLANAGTHTPDGTTVTVGVRREADEAVLTVADTGPGIPAELQPHIFERFARGDSSRSRAAGSTGLGLAIVAAVVAAHGGTVAVASAPGRTQFTVRLPVAAGPPPEDGDGAVDVVDAASGEPARRLS